jgi:hypothetical protein
MRRRYKTLAVLLLAAVATLASSNIPGTVHMVYPGTMDCAQGCQFAAGGWPFRYLVDSHGISVGGSVSLLGGLAGEDILHPGLLVATYVFWLALFTALVWFVRVVQGNVAIRARDGQPPSAT